MSTSLPTGLNPRLLFLLGEKTPSNQAMLVAISPYFDAFAKQYEITNSLRLVHLFTQLAHESNWFGSVEENLRYSETGLLKTFPNAFKTPQSTEGYVKHPEKIANRIYANKYGNGNEASGDGWKYRGRGFIQLTFKDNYKAVSKALGVDFVSEPNLLIKPEYLLQVAGWYWKSRNLNAYADQDNLAVISKKINGGTNGLEHRREILTILKARLK